MSRQVTLTSDVLFKYVSPRGGDPILKAAFANVSDALVFWEALPGRRKRYIRPFLARALGDDEPVVLFTHTGVDNHGYSHADALTAALAERWYPDRSKRSRDRGFIDVEAP